MATSLERIEKGLNDLPLVSGAVPGRIGYVVNYSFHIWYQVVMALMKARARQYGIQEVLIRDAKQDLRIELAAMDDLIREKVELLIVTPVASPGVTAVVEKAEQVGIPLVLEANPIAGMTTMVAICDYDAGVKAGRWTGSYAREHLGGVARVLDIAYPPLRPCLLRSEGFLDGLYEIIPNTELVERVNGQAQVDVSRDLAREAFARRDDINIIFGMDDESIQGGLKAVKELGLDEDRMLLAGFGMAGDEDKDILMQGGCWRVSTAMFPEWVGLRCVDQAVKVLNGSPVKKHEVSPTVAVSRDTLPQYYTRSDEGWIPNFKAIAGIPLEDTCTKV